MGSPEPRTEQGRYRLTAIHHRRASFVRLQDLPTKVSRRILRSVTWTGVDAALPSHILLRRAIVQLNRIGGRASILRAAAVRLFH
jgi:hypothetical protein